MPRRRQQAKAHRGALSIEQFDELVFGPHYDRLELATEFVDDAGRRAAWFAHRDEVMADNPAGHRPWAWWEYESGLKDSLEKPRPRGDTAVAWLRKHGFLTAWEEKELAKQRRLFEDPAASTLSPESAKRMLSPATTSKTRDREPAPGGAS